VKRNILGSITIILAAILFSSFANAEGGDFQAKNGFYISLGAANNTLEGDFDGKTFFVGSSDIILVRDVDSGIGLKIALGNRSPKSTFEASFSQSSHDVTFSGFQGDADLTLVNLDWRSFFSVKSRVQPFLLYGLNYSRFVVEDGSATLSL